MESLNENEQRCFQLKDFDEISERRAKNREILRGRNNVTSCRSPPRDLDTRWIKNELQRKRDLEFARRRTLSPDLFPSKTVKTGEQHLKRMTFTQPFSITSHDLTDTGSDTLHINTPVTSSPNRHSLMMRRPRNSMSTDDLSTSKWASMLSKSVVFTEQNKGFSIKQETTTSLSTSVIKGPGQVSKTEGINRNGPMTSSGTCINTGKMQQNERQSNQIVKTPQEKMLREASVQTEPGLVTIRESDVQQLADYLQEALWREEAVRKKLAVLQESGTTLLGYSKTLWTARCSEDLLRNKINALEVQLQASLQRGGMKKLLAQMEKQRSVYEEKALAALQKATEEKAEALCQAKALQEALVSATAEGSRWQGLYEELRQSTAHLKESHLHSTGQLQQLQSRLELLVDRDEQLTHTLESLQQEKETLQSRLSFLEEDNQSLREIQSLGGTSTERQDSIVKATIPAEGVEENQTLEGHSILEEQFRQTQERLKLKEKECEELQTELEAMEHECQSSQTRLTQCREELRQLSHMRRNRRLCGSRWRLCLFLLLLLAAVGVAILWLWHPSFWEQVEDLYLDLETRLEGYLLEMSSPRPSGCYRPT